MKKLQLEIIHNLSRNDKFELVHLLWDDIAKEQYEIGIPEEHQKILAQRLERIKTGKASFRSWDEIKRK
ncbi:MAG: addiction module protein [Bacteroidales bacterium]|nr:addiction module protein [Bacteroidales bacterium]MCF8456096.1 addiction module protein [Bacteroidales bacterium]